jgi:hypothetical protein
LVMAALPFLKRKIARGRIRDVTAFCMDVLARPIRYGFGFSGGRWIRPTASGRRRTVGRIESLEERRGRIAVERAKWNTGSWSWRWNGQAPEAVTE